MLITNLKIIFRSFLNRKLYSFINILSLFIGLASFLIIYLYVVDELSYDKFYEKSDRTYRVLLFNNYHGEDETSPKTPIPLGNTLQTDFPEVETVTTIATPSGDVVKVLSDYGEKVFNQSNILAADSNFFKVFSYSLKSGDANSALKEPYSIVLTNEIAEKYFPNKEAVGQTVVIGESQPQVYKVTAVLDEIKYNTHIKFGVLTSLNSYDVLEDMKWSWMFNIMTTYVVLKKGSDPAFVTAKFSGMVQKYLPATFKKLYLSFDEFIAGSGIWKYELQSLEDIRLYSAGIGNPLGPMGDIKYVYIFSLIGVFVLIVACINYINLATALSARKSKEIGVYKTFGAQNKELFMQLMIEPFIYNFLALILSLIAVSLTIGYINQIIDRDLSLRTIFDPLLFLPFLGIVILTSFLAGFYPAYKFTTVNPIMVLKSSDFSNKPKNKRQIFNMRKSLVIFQFVLSNVLFASALIVSDQLQFLQKADVGFEKDNVIIISNGDKLGTNIEPFLNKLMDHTFVESASISSSLPSKKFFSNWYTPKRSEVENVKIASSLVDTKTIPLLGINVVQGRNFSEDINERRSVIINTTLAENLNWEDPIGQKIMAGDDGMFEVVGVVKDFNYVSLREKIRPFAFFHYSSNIGFTEVKYISIKVRGNNWNDNIKQIESMWKEASGLNSLEYSFLKEEYNQQYKGEQNMNVVVNYFTIFCLIIACLGLYGLVAFSVEKKRKEIGIRKVLGASSSSIVYLILKEFATLLFIALLIAVPFTYVVMDGWINSFRYHTDISLDNFLFAGSVTIIISILTVIIKTLKAAELDPSETLKYE
ncbi:MAG: putative ABC transport system permease protein [Cyclobacteriaceae bacterium]|jgi:putative ABC transport system permease protein